METGTKKFWISKLVRTRGFLGKENIMGMKDCWIKKDILDIKIKNKIDK